MITAQILKRDILEIYEDKFQGYDNIRIQFNPERIIAFSIKNDGVHSLSPLFSAFEFMLMAQIKNLLNFSSIDEIEINLWHGTIKVTGYAPNKTFKML